MTSRAFTKPAICITFPRAQVFAQHSADVIGHTSQHSSAIDKKIVASIEAQYPMIQAYVEYCDNVPTVQMSQTARKLSGATDSEIESIIDLARK